MAIVALAAADFAIATVAYQIRRPAPRHTDFASYYLAGTFALERRSPYHAEQLRARSDSLALDQEAFAFVYPPAFALAMRPLARLPFARARAVWMLFDAAVLGAALSVLWRLLRAQADALGIDDLAVWLVYAASVAAILNSAGVHSDVRLGSVGALLFLAFSVVALCMMRGGRPAGWCGAALAAAATVKLAPVAVAVWAAWRGARRAALIAAGFAAAGAIVASTVFGAGIHAAWLRDGVWARLATVDAWAVNQSIGAVVTRLLDPRTMYEIEPVAPPAARILTTIVCVAIVAATLVVLRKRVQQGQTAAWIPVELGMIVTALLLVMPLTWVHTLVAAAFVWPTQVLVLWPAAHAGVRWARWAMVASSTGFFLSAAHLPYLWSGRFHHHPWVWITAGHCAGVLVLWMVAAASVCRAGSLRGRD